MLLTLALVHAELGAAYPVAGGTARFPYFAFGTLAGFTAGWAAYLQAVTIAPIEVEAAISYLEQHGLGAEALQHAQHQRHAERLGLLVASVGDAAVHGDQPARRQAAVRQQLRRW